MGGFDQGPNIDVIATRAPGAGKKLTAFGVLTGGWLVLGVCFGWYAHQPEGCLGTFACLTANEWGDFLAGVFAPIAFLWLVAAVWIQSDELREQRQELALTRQEMKDNRLVMSEQAEEARKQAEFVGTQTDILKRNQIDDELRAFLAVFQYWVFHNFKLMRHVPHGARSILEDHGYLTHSMPDDPVAFFIEFCSRLEAAVEDRVSSGGQHQWDAFSKSTNKERFFISSYLQKVASYQGRVSPSLQMVITTTTVEGLSIALSEALSGA